MSAIPDLWHPETVYLNTASFGLPPDPVWDALTRAQEDWRAGRVSWEHWTAVTGRGGGRDGGDGAGARRVRAAGGRRRRPRRGRGDGERADRPGRGGDPGRLAGALD